MKALEAENKVTILYISDPSNETQRKTATSLTTRSSSNLADACSNISSNDLDQAPPAKKSASAGSHGGANNQTGQNSLASIANSSPSIKTKQESDEAALSTSSSNPINESSNSTLKRRQETEQLRKHTTPGEHIRFIATARHKKARLEMLTRKQLRHLSRRPWERRGKSKS